MTLKQVKRAIRVATESRPYIANHDQNVISSRWDFVSTYRFVGGVRPKGEKRVIVSNYWVHDSGKVVESSSNTEERWIAA